MSVWKYEGMEYGIMRVWNMGVWGCKSMVRASNGKVGYGVRECGKLEWNLEYDSMGKWGLEY